MWPDTEVDGGKFIIRSQRRTHNRYSKHMSTMIHTGRVLGEGPWERGHQGKMDVWEQDSSGTMEVERLRWCRFLLTTVTAAVADPDDGCGSVGHLWNALEELP